MYYGYSDEDTNKIIKPLVTDSNFLSLGPEDLCIVDDGDYMYLYVGKALPNELIYDIFGYEDFSQLVHYGVRSLEVEMETDAYTRVINIVEQIRSENSGAFQPIFVVLQDSVFYKNLRNFALIEDSIAKNREFSYDDFLSHIHNVIRTQY
jgi:hypothetical protein